LTVITQLDFSHERDLTVDILISRISSYYPDADFSLLRKANAFAEKAHAGQKRRSGEDYIIHPLNVASTLIKLKMDMESIVCGLLHDVIEDCHVDPSEVQKEFTPGIAAIVVALTKISKIQFKSEAEDQATNFRNMVVAMAKDLRVIIVKLADRMHNMRTLQYVSEIKQKQKAQETLDIYVPLASRLGINSVKAELEDLCLRFLKPDIYYRLAEKVAMKKAERERYIAKTIETVREKLFEYSVQAEVSGRPKHFYSVYKKMVSRGVEFEQIQDLLAFRLIVPTIPECYKVLGIVHSTFTPIPGRFKDYIAIPKVNNYQSLHTTVIGPDAQRIEMQVRTYEMHEVAERGVAAHWKYKEGIIDGKTRLDWLQELLEVNQGAGTGAELLNVVKHELDSGVIYVFTPKGDVIELSYNSTPLDFAYAIHTQVGEKCVGAKVNGKMVPLKFRLKSGDTLDILTSKTQSPSKDWLNIVKTTRAKTKIRQWLQRVEREQFKDVGEEILEKAFKAVSSSLKAVRKSGDLVRIFPKLKIKSEEELFVAVGLGKIFPPDVVKLIPGFSAEDTKKLEEDESFYKKVSQRAKRASGKDNAVLVDGADDILVRMAKCCNPIPGDNIVGYITRGRGVTVHSVDCARRSKDETSPMVTVEWNPNFAFKHPVLIKVITQDRPGVLALISKTINNVGVNIRSAVAKSMSDNKGNFLFEIEVKDYSELLKVIGAVETVDDVISVSRA
jgi:GTP pyrophosphokinase